MRILFASLLLIAGIQIIPGNAGQITSLGTYSLPDWTFNLAVPRDGTFIVTRELSAVHFWNPATMKQIAAIEYFWYPEGSDQGLTTWPTRIALNPAATRLAVVSDDGILRVWSVESVLTKQNNRIYRETPLASWDAAGFGAIAYSARWLVYLSADSEHILWRDDKGTVISLGDPLPPKAKENLTFNFSPDGAHFAVGTGDQVVVWDTTTQTVEAEHQFSQPVGQLNFDPSGKWLAVSQTKGFALWNFSSGEIRQLGDESFNTPVFSPDGELLASVQTDGSRVVLWDLQHGDQVGALSFGCFSDVGFLPDMTRIFTTHASAGCSGLMMEWGLQP